MPQPRRALVSLPPRRCPNRGVVILTRGATKSPQAGGSGLGLAFVGRPGSYFNRIELCSRGFTDPIPVQAYGGEVEWSVNGTGRLSVLIPASVAAPTNGWRGRWVHFRDRLCGPWGGYVEDEPVNLGQGVVELSCSGLAGFLNGARTPRLFGTQHAPAGALARRATSDADRSTPMPWETFTADEGGAWLEQEWRAESVLSVWQSLARQSGEYWTVTVDDDKAVSARWFRQPRDMRGRVLLIEGYQFQGSRIAPGSLSQVRNDMLAIADGSRLGRAAAEVVIDRASIKRWGAWQTSERFVANTSSGTLQGLARRRLALSADPPVQIEIVMAARHPYQQLIREGDIVRVWSRAAGRRYDFTIFSRHLSLGNRTVTLRGDAVEV